MKRKRNQLILSLLSKKDPYNDKNAIDFKWSYVQEQDEEDIALANFIESLQKQIDEEIKKITWWWFDDCGIVNNQKKNKEDFSWSNFLN